VSHTWYLQFELKGKESCLCAHHEGTEGVTSALEWVFGQPQAPVTLHSLTEDPVPTAQKAGWVPEPVWTFLGREQSLAPDEIPAPDRSTGSLVTIPAELLRFLSSTFPIAIWYLFLHSTMRVLRTIHLNLVQSI
jgi:hypothetical protein